MSGFKNCDNCVWWSYTYPDELKRFGTCENDFVQDSVRLSQDYDTVENEDPTIFTEASFCCNFHEGGNEKTLLILPVQQ